MSEKSGLKLSLLNEHELKNSIIDLVSEIKLITGAVLHAGQMLDMQIEMLQRFIVGGFGMLSKSEVVQAFYMNLQGQFEDVYVHYNKELNAEFVGNVLRGYLRYKKQFLREKRDLIIDAIQPALPPVKKDIDYDFWKEMVQEDFRLLCLGLDTNTLWFDRKYYTIRKFGLMPFKGIKTWFYFMRKALMHFDWGINMPRNANLQNFHMVTVNQIYILFKHPEDFKKCVQIARKYAYWHILNACKECGINNIWNDVKGEGK